MSLQKDRLHSADATIISVDSFRRDLWMFLYKAYFVWLPTMYFHCAGCARLCPGLRSLGCGWLWDECSPRLLGSRKPSPCRPSRLFKGVFITLPYRRKQALVWRQMPPKSHCPSIYRHLYPSRDEVRRVQVNVLLQYSRGHFIDDASRLCSLHHCMHWSWSTKILHNVKKFREDIDVFG